MTSEDARETATEVFKVTGADRRTRGGMQWGEGVQNRATGRDSGLCSNGWIHAFEHPLLAAFFDPLFTKYGPTALLWRAEASGEVLRPTQSKLGCKVLRTVGTIPMPLITTEQRVEIGIRCALAVDTDPGFRRWADAWLDASDRTEESAWKADRARIMLAAPNLYEGGRAYTGAVAASAVATAAAAMSAVELSAEAGTEALVAEQAAHGAALASGADPRLDILAIIKAVVERPEKQSKRPFRPRRKS